MTPVLPRPIAHATGLASVRPARPGGAGPATTDPPARPATRLDAEAFDRLSGVATAVRDEAMRLRWCNEAFVRLCKRDRAELMGTTPHDLIPSAAADERCEIMRTVLRTGVPFRAIQFGADKRLLCTVGTIEAADWGFTGVLATVQDAPVGTMLADGAMLPMLATPLLDDLAALSPRELEILYHIGSGLSTAAVGTRIHRSAKTVEKHLESVHRKLGTSSRSELVRLAVERGIQAFSAEEWSTLVDGARRVKRTR